MHLIRLVLRHLPIEGKPFEYSSKDEHQRRGEGNTENTFTAKAFAYEDFTPEQLEALRGPQGIQGPVGPQGPQGDNKIGVDFTTDIAVGRLTAGTEIKANMTIGEIIRRILMCDHN